MLLVTIFLILVTVGKLRHCVSLYRRLVTNFIRTLQIDVLSRDVELGGFSMFTKVTSDR